MGRKSWRFICQKNTVNLICSIVRNSKTTDTCRMQSKAIILFTSPRKINPKIITWIFQPRYLLHCQTNVFCCKSKPPTEKPARLRKLNIGYCARWNQRPSCLPRMVCVATPTKRLNKKTNGSCMGSFIQELKQIRRLVLLDEWAIALM